MGVEGLGSLNSEWTNLHHDSMRPLLTRLLALKKEKTYEQAMYDLCIRAFERHVSNLEYVAHLLYLVDERRYPIVALQPIVGIQQGHLYRTFSRAGVKFLAATSNATQVEDSLYAWPAQVHVDPSRGVCCVDGREYAFDDPESPLLVWMDEAEKTFRLSYRDGGLKPKTPPPFPGRRRSAGS